ncbi:hypothetical protein ZWY2020_018763 [Hordeum vulgare]|nr:hypothetical protein ZWY2020_018763 [Hordeum vulgare]
MNPACAEAAAAKKSRHKDRKEKKSKRKDPAEHDGGEAAAAEEEAVHKKKKKKQHGKGRRRVRSGSRRRAAAVFRIDEIVVFDSSPEEESGARFLVRILEMETPQYLRRRLLPPLDALHHVRKHEWSEFREGVTLGGDRSKGTPVDVGLSQALATLLFALWTVFQGPLLEEYPSKLLNTTLQIFFATVQSFFMALVMERDFSRWKLRLDVGLVAIVYCGIVVSAFSNYLLIWLIGKCGPVFLAMTVPLTFVITIVLSLLIGEAVTLGSIISGVLMVGGLYNVLWGKRIEQVALSKQGGIEANAASFDLEEQESGAPEPAPLTRDSIKRCERED